MPLSAEDVHRIAELARIELGAVEQAHMLDQLNSVFELIEQLKAVDTGGVEPMTHAQDVRLRLREDQVSEPDRRADYQAVAPRGERGQYVERGLYLVPKVIE
jgi:aspartyl-tRNA(Asn)/glutamyl-tRNA(Gln) amidotransferase subunit C